MIVAVHRMQSPKDTVINMAVKKLPKKNNKDEK